MAKILISSIGVGGKFKNPNNPDREYRKTCYKIEDKSYPESTFIASVLYENFNLDGIIFIGTVKSMWEEVYSFFCEKKSVQKNDDYWVDLALKIDNSTYESELNSIELAPLEEVLGKHSKCILTKYGLNESELWLNFDKIIEIIDFLQPGDEIYFDITHSFRSLSLFIFLTVTFLQDLVSEKNITIAGVYYGMLDVTSELKYTPVVDLKPLFDMTSWIKGAYSLKNNGNGYLISQLLESQGEKELATQIENLSDAINLNYVNAIQQRSSTLKTSLQNKTIGGPFKYLKNILEKFVNQFTRSSSVSESQFQLKLAGWYFDNKRYATGYTTLVEAIITYMCEIHDKDIRIKDQRDEMKNILFQHNNKNSKLTRLFEKVNPIRTSIAHALLEEGRKTSKDSDAIKNAKTYQQEAKKIFQTRTLDY